METSKPVKVHSEPGLVEAGRQRQAENPSGAANPTGRKPPVGAPVSPTVTGARA